MMYLAIVSVIAGNISLALMCWQLGRTQERAYWNILITRGVLPKPGQKWRAE